MRRYGGFWLAALLLLTVAAISMVQGQSENAAPQAANAAPQAANAGGGANAGKGANASANARDREEDEGADAVADDDTYEPESMSRRIGIPSPGPLFQVDLRYGQFTSPLPEGVSWVSRLTGNTRRCRCDRRGVLKLSFGPLRRRAQIKMTFEYSWRFTFNLGDSSTNNGWGGDASTQSNDAEVHSYSKSMFFFGRDNPPASNYGLLYSEPNFVGAQPYTTLTLNVKDEVVHADNGFHTIYFNSYKLFQLAGQPDATGPVNYDLYLGMNRVVGSSYRNGHGLCKVSVRFFPV